MKEYLHKLKDVKPERTPKAQPLTTHAYSESSASSGNTIDMTMEFSRPTKTLIKSSTKNVALQYGVTMIDPNLIEKFGQLVEEEAKFPFKCDSSLKDQAEKIIYKTISMVRADIRKTVFKYVTGCQSARAQPQKYTASPDQPV